MDTSTVYTRMPSTLKEKIEEIAKRKGAQLGETIIDLLNQGLKLPESLEKLDKTQYSLQNQEENNRNLNSQIDVLNTKLRIAQQTLDSAERAKIHLQRILNTTVGTCKECSASINLYGFAYQQCPNGHSGTIKLLDQYKGLKNTNEIIVSLLAMVGGVAIAAELLGDRGSQRRS